MTNQSGNKSTVEQIRERFDHEVERFANLETGQTPLLLDLVSEAASRVTPHAKSLLDVGCGAGNFTLKILERMPNLEVTLADLSRPMLDRALQRVGRVTSSQVVVRQGDIRELPLEPASYDVICAAAVLHHLREEHEWHSVFAKLFAALRPGGSFWISDLVLHSDSRVQTMMWQRYGQYLTQLKDEAYRDLVFAYIEQEDTPRSLRFQMDLLQTVGFRQVEILHKHNCFAAFGGIK